MEQLTALDEARDLIERGAMFYVSHSGGKDSQAMYSILFDLVPTDQIVVVHADLGEVEWTGVIDHIDANTAHEINVVRAIWKDGSTKDLLSMVERRHEARPDSPPWPSSAMRFCTSDLKRDPIHKFIRRDLAARGKLLAVNCTGIRAEESSARAHKNPFALNSRLSKAGREVYEWLPIFNYTEAEVFEAIAQAGQAPFWAYRSNRRLSCVFCIMGCGGDLAHGARERPELLERYIELEERTGWTMFHGESLAERIARNEADLFGSAA